MWNVANSLASCVPRTCAETPDADCAATTGCKAATSQPAGYPTCVATTCSDITVACDCHSSSHGCTWSNSKCVNKYTASCPAKIDLVVAVDATMALANAFGRFNVGLLGVSQLLRNFLPTLPLSTDAARTAVLQLSADAASVTCADAFCGLTGDSNNEFQQLDWLAATTGRSSVSANSATTALQWVKSNQATGRKTVVVLITAAPFGDDASALVSELQAAGTDVFGVVAQRESLPSASEATNKAALATLLGSSSLARSVELEGLETRVLRELCNPQQFSLVAAAAAPYTGVECHTGSAGQQQQG